MVVLAADAVMAALPATAVQLAHACLAAGFRSCETLPTHYPVSTGILVARA